MKQGDSKKGFTIIEVVLVLAVAGLIFIMVFVALPALQRSQRDNARRDDMMKFISEVKKYQTSNRGTLPGSSQVNSDVVNVTPASDGSTSGAANTWGGFYHDYLGNNYIDPDGEYYKLLVTKCNSTTDAACQGAGTDGKKFIEEIDVNTFSDNNYRIGVILQAKCSGSKAVGSSNPRNLAVLYRLEGSGTFCFNT